MLLALFVFALIAQSFASVAYQSLGGSVWSAAGNEPPSNIVFNLPQATVPGCIHLDWMKGKNITNDLYYRFNDDAMKWIPKANWKYTLHFKPNEPIMHTYEQWLVFEGVDTVANITLNGVKLGQTTDMFKVYRFNISSLLQINFNVLEVAFESALSYTNSLSASQKYSIPPACPPDAQHGFCHVNFIRKEQCSFSWDWGPAFATQGIWKPVYLMSLNYAVITDATAVFDFIEKKLEVDVRFLLVMFAEDLPLYGNVTVTIEELNVSKHFANVELPRSKNELTEKKFFIDLENVAFDLWWPNGYGMQKLYNVSVSFRASRGYDESEKHFLFGFRKVELVQEPLSGSEGLSFYFRINDQPVFAKGANWIPADAFTTRITDDTYVQLLESAADAHMNMLRVWGGGIYEKPILYETADRLGIMLWQDFMFACALYPSDADFLTNVTQEVSDVLWKLKHHPSIVVWAGNNENEAALSTDWYNTTAHFDRYKRDYIDLYIDTIEQKVRAMDQSRPFVSSSPSNGKETVAEGGLAKNPYDTHYGDVHYYNYNDDCLDWTKYPATRFASEYGFQSWPSFEAIEPITIEEDRAIDSKWAEHRQHHPTGNKEMVNQIAMHFQMPPQVEHKTQSFADLIYLTQIMQGLCYKSQTEFYRRSRNEVVNGAGYTMGALYWQLNDIWQAPTWSSLEYGGKWKALHYMAERFFSSVTLIAYDDDTTMKVYAASDIAHTIEGKLVVTVHTWDEFAYCGYFNQSVTIPSHSSTLIYQQSVGTLLHFGGCPYKEMCYISLHIEGIDFIPTNHFFPVPFKNIQHLHTPVFKVENVTKLSNDVYDVTLSTSTPALFVWLEARHIKGRFSENAFVMDEAIKRVKFYSWTSNLTVEHLREAITVRSVNELMNTTDDPTDKPATPDPLLTVSWLENETIKLTFAVVGFLLIVMTSSQVICLVLRMNNPTIRPKNPRYPDVKGCKRSACGTASNDSSIGSEMSSLGGGVEDDATGFLIRTKKEGKKKIEYRFYII